jgi:hypothetical protein
MVVAVLRSAEAGGPAGALHALPNPKQITKEDRDEDADEVQGHR